ncbi:MAG: phosphoribosylamine--glycine ligase, partial [Euryarchaeota archaeon RBG_16_62_10]
MRVLAIGGGAREHAIVEALRRSGAEVFACMRNRNPGIARAARGYLLEDENDIPKVVEFARLSGVELAVVGPEAPLEAGLSDGLRDADIPVASPSKAAARIETSKSFMRELLSKHKVKGSVEHAIVGDKAGLRKAVDRLGTAVVVKPVGLTGGKGVKVFGEHLMTREDIIAYGEEILSKGIGRSAKLVIEEKLVGEEFTVQAFCDGRRVVPMPAAQDHKRAYEGDKGPNTGGMGSYSQADGLLPFLRGEEHDAAVRIMTKVVEALRKEGSEYRGTLYGQFMLTKAGPKVIEFNARFGDPEAMNVLTLLRSDFVSICSKMSDGTISKKDVQFAPKASVCKYVVPEGYGTKSLAGEPITVDEKAIEKEGAVLYYAAVDEKDGKVYTTSSRSVGIVGVADSIEEAERISEKALKHVSGKIHVRHDIAKKEMLDSKVRR